MTEPDAEMRAAYKEVAAAASDALLSACRRGDGGEGLVIVRKLCDHNDFNLIVFTFGRLAQMVVDLEAAVMETNAPLVERDLAENPISPHEVAAYDQMAAAVENGDFRGYAALAVDGQLKALARDEAGMDGDMTFDHIASASMLMDRRTLALTLSEALFRLYQKGGS